MLNNSCPKLDTVANVILKTILETFPKYYNVDIHSTTTTRAKDMKLNMASIDIINSTASYRVSLMMAQKLSSIILDSLFNDMDEDEDPGLDNHLALEILNTIAGLSLSNLEKMTIGTPYIFNATDKQRIDTMITIKTNYGNITCYINKIRTDNETR